VINPICIECGVEMILDSHRDSRHRMVVFVCPKCKMEKPMHLDHPMFSQEIERRQHENLDHHV
jgi:hypothetical protein